MELGTGLASLVVLVSGLFVVRPDHGENRVVSVGAGSTTPEVATREAVRAGRFRPADPGAYVTLDGSDPRTFPPTRLALGFLALDGSADAAWRAWGPPDASGDDIFGPSSSWSFVGGAEVGVGTSIGTGQVYGVWARVPVGGGLRVGAFGGLVLGRSTVADVVRAWGPGFDPARSVLDDYVIRYVMCVGPEPVVAKFDAAGKKPELLPVTSADPAAEVLRVTSALVAYADEPPGSSGCP